VAYTLDYFSPRVLETIESWPVEILADYAKLVELLLEHGPNLRMPHSRSMGEGLFELRPRGREGIGRTFYCFLVGKQISVVHAFIKKSEATPDRELKIARKRVKVLKNG
jgi:phage-related protein